MCLFLAATSSSRSDSVTWSVCPSVILLLTLFFSYQFCTFPLCLFVPVHLYTLAPLHLLGGHGGGGWVAFGWWWAAGVGQVVVFGWWLVLVGGDGWW